MSAQMKRTGMKGVITLAVMVFVFLVFHEIAFAPSAEAAPDCGYYCYWNGLQPDCFDPIFVFNCYGCKWTDGSLHCSNN